MADAGSEQKTEKATPQRLRKAREKGQVARSKEVAAAVGLLVSLKLLALMAPGLLNDFRSLLMLSMPTLDADGALENAWSVLFTGTLVLLAKMVLPLLVIPAAIVVASMLPGGWLFSPQQWQPDLSRINPLSGFARLFSAQRLTDVVKSIAKALLLGTVLFWLSRRHLADFMRLQSLSTPDAVSRGALLVYDLCFAYAMVFVLFAVIDVPLQAFFFQRSLRMSRQEIREEMKNTEGKPEIRSRIRQLQRQIAQRGLTRTVPTANVILTNPTHYAVALRYDESLAEAPYIVAKGTDETAQAIRAIAARHQIEVLEVPALARAVYHTTRVNQQIPAALYKAVAYVLSYVLQLKAFRDGRRDSAPVFPTDLAVPRDLSEPKP
ncbi:flagellar biosynthesis protein FlhB [Paludibacterium paludis]|uniref:Flagellar biosynthetic protein FlhB n=1 Tax=Paludibacterium paludis TaxID=1225769 RepID=A0A918NXH7_9NEIS|nr:flagellar biosynthesis protein FlhB [Paludibacterium paludis]GGY04539.1 flagellar biosynthesis protein FlhB [Paludibacterium paludis]